MECLLKQRQKILVTQATGGVFQRLTVTFHSSLSPYSIKHSECFPEHSALPSITFSAASSNSAMCLLLDILWTSQHGKTELVPPPTSLKAPRTTHLLGQDSGGSALDICVKGLIFKVIIIIINTRTV